MIESYNRISIYQSSCLDELNRKFRIDTRFQLSDSTQILESNILIRLEYLNQEFWLESSLDESKTRLNLDDSTRRDQSTWSTHIFVLCLLYLVTQRLRIFTWIQSNLPENLSFSSNEMRLTRRDKRCRIWELLERSR